MIGEETGARAGVGTWTGEGRDAEMGIWAEIVAAAWAVALAVTGAKAGAGAVACTWTGAEVKAGAGLKVCVWSWD